MEIEASKSESGPVRIDVGAVLRGRLGKRASHIPRPVVSGLERLIRQDEMNEMLRIAYPKRGAAFCRAVIEHLGITVATSGEENIPRGDGSRAIFVSNHPLGGLDGLALIDFVERVTGRTPRFVVNDLLMAVEPLKEVFLPVNKHGEQSRASIGELDRALGGNDPVIIFPAGLCSRRSKGKVTDLEWRKTFVVKAREHHRDIIPLHFAGENTALFYKTAQWRKRLGLKFNIEMILLPSELFKARGKTFTITAGKPIAWQSLTADTRAEVKRIRKTVDSL